MEGSGNVGVDVEEFTIGELKKIYDALVVPRVRPRLCILFYLLILPAYTCFGGAIFWFTDLRSSQDAQKRFDRACITEKQASMRKLWTSYITLNISGENIRDFWNEISETIEYVDNCHRESMRDLRPKVFKPYESIVFSFGVITTIGYGDLYLEREQGWDFIDSLHYTFATASLIGYGDLTPMRPASYVFIFMPLCFIAETLLCLVYGFLQRTYRFHSVALARLFILQIRRIYGKTFHSQSTKQVSSRLLADGKAAQPVENDQQSAIINKKIQAELKELHKSPSADSVAMLAVPLQSKHFMTDRL
ncbi:unnamed protein product [Anisakis simplex]|uniref:Ion_trans_2 domain-containing protein n=1 Tax=Anisakis simplex TaxID=6269 RepID=A0A0M3IZV3_ANISI|nr:unnamed protein product [Anisakis simplex]